MNESVHPRATAIVFVSGHIRQAYLAKQLDICIYSMCAIVHDATVHYMHQFEFIYFRISIFR